MAIKDRKIFILFLKTFKQELQRLAETMNTKTLKRSELENVFAFKIANDEEKNVIHEMVSEVAIKGDELNTGQNSLIPATLDNQVSDGSTNGDLGKTKTYANSHFRSDKEAA